jgi:adenylate cyclase
MNAEGIKRKLTAILSADVEGYTRLMSQDEVGTIRTLTAYREAMATLINQYKGRVVDAPGDNLLAEFASVVDAVNCAVEIQRDLAERNAELPSARKMQFRIGINIGEVVEEEERIYGDGVNIAARIESLAARGGICISGKVYDEVKNKLGLGYEYLGEKSVKNIPEPVRVYRLLSYLGAAAQIEPASLDRMEHALPEEPSIAVLPFENLSGDPEQEYFSDGLTEEIITALSKMPGLFVIARNSTFTYKGKPVKVQQVAEELGVRYLLEGSVRKGGDKIRITAQLIDALTGHHLWAERYDQDLNVKNIFEIHDAITIQVLKSLDIKIRKTHSAFKGTPENLEVFIKRSKASNLQLGATSLEEVMMARQLYEEAIALEPDCSGTYVGLAWNYNHEADRCKTPQKAREARERGIEAAKKAISLDETDSHGHVVLAKHYAGLGLKEKANATFERAMSIDPNNPEAYVFYAWDVLRLEKRYGEAINYIEKAKRLNPFPDSWYYQFAALIYLEDRNWEKAIPDWKHYIEKRQLLGRPVGGGTYLSLARCSLALGREEEAIAAATELLKMNPKFPLKSALNTAEFQNNPAKERLLDALYNAGLLKKEEEFSEGTAIEWKSNADGFGKDGIFTRKNPPAFSFEYPADFIIQPLQANDIFRIIGSGGLPVVNIAVGKIAGGVEDFLHAFEERIKKALANLGTDVTIVYNQPLPPGTYGEDYPSQELEITWMWGGTTGLRSYVNVIAKGEYYISMQGHFAGVEEEGVWLGFNQSLKP